MLDWVRFFCNFDIDSYVEVMVVVMSVVERERESRESSHDEDCDRWRTRRNLFLVD